MSDEFLPVGQLSNKNKLVETSSSGTVAPLVASWAQASTASMGALAASTEIIGYVKIDQTTPGTSNAVTVATTSGGILFSTGLPGKIQALASTEKIGALQTSTEIVGYVKIDQTTPGASNAVVVTTTSGGALFSTGLTGKVQALASTEVIGYIVANASTAKIGALQASTESIGYVTALVSTAKIGALQASTESIGYVTGLVSTAQIGRVLLNPSTEIIGYVKIDQTTPGTSNGVVLATTGSEFWQNNQAVTLLASTSRTATTNSADQTNYNASALLLQVLNDTATGPTLTPSLQIKDSISASYFTIWTAAAGFTSTGHRAYLFDVGGVGGAGSYTEATPIRVNRTWRLVMTHSSSGATQYSVSGEHLL